MLPIQGQTLCYYVSESQGEIQYTAGAYVQLLLDELNSSSRKKKSLNKKQNQRWNTNNSSMVGSAREVSPLPSWRPLCLYVLASLCVWMCVCKSCSNWRVREDSLIQLSSVDSITNPLHLLKHPPQKTHPSPSRVRLCRESLGPGCASAFVSTPVIVPGPAPLPQPSPAPRTLIAAKTNSSQMFGKDPLFASGPNKIIFTSYPVVIRAERIEFMWHW